VISSAILAGAWRSSHRRQSTISVTGLASRDFVSDLIVWNASFSRKSMNLKETYASLKNDAEQIKKYLVSKGVKESELIFSAVDIAKDFETVYEKDESSKQVFTGYRLTQSIQIESKEVDKIESISREVTELIDSGIELYSSAPNYYYTKLAELKIEMLASASKDARNRAENISESAGGSIGDVTSASMGVFQITAPNSTEQYSWGGAFNTSSKRKTVSITVNLDFAIN
jgi:hypothetical protein